MAARPGLLLPQVLVLAWLLCPVAALGAPSDALGPLSGLEAGAFARADAVVLAGVTSVTDVRAPGGAAGRQVVNVRVLTRYKGAPGVGAALTLVVLGQRPTLDPARPSVPYFRRGERSRYVLFLQRAAGAYAWRLQTLFDADGDDGEEKIRATAAVAAWSKIDNMAVKVPRVVKDLVRMLGSRNVWTRAHAAREIGWLAQQRPQSFDARSVSQLRRLAPTGRSADERFWMRRTMQLLTEYRTAGGKAAGAAAEQDPWRAMLLQSASPQERQNLLTRLLAPGNAGYAKHAWWAWRRIEPSLRLWFVEAHVLNRRNQGVGGLRDVYAGEDDADVRSAIVRAVGLLGGAADVPWLGGRVANLALRRPALLALARIRTPEAVARLGQVRSVADEDLAAWIDHLLSEAFVEAERRAGRR